jgi:hypothetical protein
LSVALAVVSKPQTHLPIPSHVEEENEFVDEEFQHEVEVEDPFQCFVDWNFSPVYDTDVNDVEVSSLLYD